MTNEERENEELKARLVEAIVKSAPVSLRLALTMMRNGREVPGRVDGVLRGLMGVEATPKERKVNRDCYLGYVEGRILYGREWSEAEVREWMTPEERELGKVVKSGRAMEPGSWVREGRSHLVDEADRENENRLLGKLAEENPEAGLMLARDCLRKGWEVNEGLVAALMANRKRENGWELVEALALYGRRLPEGVAERLAKCEGNGELKRVLGPVLSGGKG